MRRILVLMTVVAVMVTSLPVSAPLALAVPDEEKAALKDLCKQINRFGAGIVPVDPQTGEPTETPFTDQGECIEYVNAGGEIFPIAAP